MPPLGVASDPQSSQDRDRRRLRVARRQGEKRGSALTCSKRSGAIAVVGVAKHSFFGAVNAAPVRRGESVSARSSVTAEGLSLEAAELGGPIDAR